MFIKGVKYRHSSSQDLDILVLSIIHVNIERYKLKIRYVNKRSGMIQYTGKGLDLHTDTVIIKKSDLNCWRRLSYVET